MIVWLREVLNAVDFSWWTINHLLPQEFIFIRSYFWTGWLTITFSMYTKHLSFSIPIKMSMTLWNIVKVFFRPNSIWTNSMPFFHSKHCFWDIVWAYLVFLNGSGLRYIDTYIFTSIVCELCFRTCSYVDLLFPTWWRFTSHIYFFLGPCLMTISGFDSQHELLGKMRSQHWMGTSKDGRCHF